MIETYREGEDFVKFHRIVMLAPEPQLPSLVSEVAGEDFKGGWWGHPTSHWIYNLYTQLKAHPDILATKCINGKVTLIHRTLWPCLMRVTMDAGWRKLQRSVLLDESRVLLDLVRRYKVLRMSKCTNISATKCMDRKTLKRAKMNLEKSVLVHADEEHAPEGRHETVLESWGHWCDSWTKSRYQVLTYDEAVGELDIASHGRTRSIMRRY